MVLEGILKIEGKFGKNFFLILNMDYIRFLLGFYIDMMFNNLFFYKEEDIDFDLFFVFLFEEREDVIE